MKIPDRKRIITKLNLETKHVWTDKTDNLSTLRFGLKYDKNDDYELLIEWDDNKKYWVLKLFDFTYDSHEPKWALGPLQSASDVEKELPSFIPDELK